MMAPLIVFLERLAKLPRPVKQLIVILNDVGCGFLAILIAWVLRMETLDYWNKSIALLSFTALPLSIAIFWLGGIYRSLFRYAGMGTMRGLARSFAVYATIMVLAFVVVRTTDLSRSLAVLQPLIFFVLVVMSRITARYLLVEVLNRRRFNGHIRRAAIYGAGNAGQQLARSMGSEPGIRLVAFLDDDVRLDGQRLDGTRVFTTGKLEDLIRRERLTDIFLAMPRLPRARRKEIVARIEPLSVHVWTLPQMTELVEGRVSYTDIRELDIQDLLGREPVAPNELLLSRTIVGKTVLVTGAGGSIGSELCRRIAAIGAQRLVLFERNEFALYSIEAELRNAINESAARVEILPLLGSVTDPQRLAFVFRKYRPDTVYHAAAYKHVPLIEFNPVEGIQNNIFGTLETVLAAEASRVSNFILISTDKAVRPTNVMGATKRCSELIVQATAARGGSTKYSMVRFGNVLGSSGSVVPLFREQIRTGGPVTVTHRDVTRYFMTIPEAADLVIQAAGLAKGGEVFLLDMGEPVRIIDLAKSMIRLSGLKVKDQNNPDGDICVEEVGLRPGEKLHEELLIGEMPNPTLHKRIFMAREQFVSWDILGPKLELLRSCRERAAAFSLLEALVPEFKADENSRAGVRLRVPQANNE